MSSRKKYLKGWRNRNRTLNKILECDDGGRQIERGNEELLPEEAMSNELDCSEDTVHSNLSSDVNENFSPNDMTSSESENTLDGIFSKYFLRSTFHEVSKTWVSISFKFVTIIEWL